MPLTWWLRRRAYFWFMVRELTSVAVAGYCVLLIVILWKVKQGGVEALEIQIEQTLQTPTTIGLHFIALVLSIYHSITWFKLTPQAMPVRWGEEKLPAIVIVLPNYVAWLGLSGLLVWIVCR